MELGYMVQDDRLLAMQVRDGWWEEKSAGAGQGTQHALPAPPGSSMELHANSQFEPGLPVCYNVGFDVKKYKVFNSLLA